MYLYNWKSSHSISCFEYFTFEYAKNIRLMKLVTIMCSCSLIKRLPRLWILIFLSYLYIQRSLYKPCPLKLAYTGFSSRNLQLQMSGSIICLIWLPTASFNAASLWKGENGDEGVDVTTPPYWKLERVYLSSYFDDSTIKLRKGLNFVILDIIAYNIRYLFFPNISYLNSFVQVCLLVPLLLVWRGYFEVIRRLRATSSS